MSRSQESEWYLGMMSGTSFDGIDLSLLRTDGRSVKERGPSETFDYDAVTREKLSALMGKRRVTDDMNDLVTSEHIKAFEAFIAKHPLMPPLRAIGFHGQTIFHDPSKKLTIQLGDGAVLARHTGVATVSNFREADVAAGGQGAPLAPIYHAALLEDYPRPAVLVNIGGLSNVSWTDGERLIGFDSGIGNARLDDWMMERVQLPFDPGGAYARRGTVNQCILETALRDPYYARPPAKSLDRDELIVQGLEGLSTEDGAATLAAISADAIIMSKAFFPGPPKVWIISGGGRKNMAIMQRLKERAQGQVLSAEDAELDGDGMEAELIAFLAARTLASLPITFPLTTGCSEPLIGGRVNLP